MAQSISPLTKRPKYAINSRPSIPTAALSTRPSMPRQSPPGGHMMLLGIALAGVMATPAFAGNAAEEVTVPEATPKTRKELKIEFLRYKQSHRIDQTAMWTGMIVAEIGTLSFLVGEGFYGAALSQQKQHKDPGTYFDSETERNADLQRYGRNRTLAYGLTYGGLGSAALGVGLILVADELSFTKWKGQGYAVSTDRSERKRSWTLTPSIQLSTHQATYGLRVDW